MQGRPFVTLFVLFALVLGVASAGAQTATGRAPHVGGCTPGAAYDPACDVDHDNDVDIFDIQLAAGHWNQAGTFVSDNNHTHLGQTWAGNNNPLKFTGSYGAPEWAPLVLGNSVGDGLRVESAGGDGVYLNSASFNGVTIAAAGSDGVEVYAAGDDGVHVYHAGSPAVQFASSTHDGIEVEGAQGNGLFVGAANNGVYVQNAGSIGVYAHTEALFGAWGFYTPERIYGSIGLFDALSLVAQVSGPDGLSPGDLVAVAGLGDPLPGRPARTPLVRLASNTFTGVIGVVESRLVMTPGSIQVPLQANESTTGLGTAVLRYAGGPAQAGDYVAITVLGAAQVRVDARAVIEAGQRLTVGSQPGHARALRTVTVDGVTLDEGGPILGVALAPARDGLVWVLVALK